MAGRRRKPPVPADVCLLLEGTYPFVAGGVSTWVHDLIRAQAPRTFHLVTILATGPTPAPRYELPENVVGHTVVFLHEVPRGPRRAPTALDPLMRRVGAVLERLFTGADLSDLARFEALVGPWRRRLGRRQLMDSKAAWAVILDMYERAMPAASFSDYFWSWRSLCGSIFACMLAELPPARVYHALSTGYGGLMAARAGLETGRPVLLTEHGIYTNERRIEVAAADWLYQARGRSLSLERTGHDLREVWIRTFVSLSRICYDACTEIITLYGGNQVLQREDGADPARQRIIPNGIDYARLSALPPDTAADRRPTIALIGRVVPIKDVKTYIRAAAMLREHVADVEALVLGPFDEDPEYYEDCLAMVRHLRLEETVRFTGRVPMHDWLPRIDVVVLTSISEAQPLVILEAGAAAIPTVATNVGACSEMILGRPDEDPPLGAGGAITPLANPAATARALRGLLTDPDRRAACGAAIRRRVERLYNKTDIDRQYAALYDTMIAREDRPAA